MREKTPDMIDAERLVQRFVDQELSAEERVRFVVRLGRDAALRQGVMDLEKLVLEVGRLPRPTMPDGFVVRVMERTKPARPTWHRLSNALWAPRSLQWNVASAVAVACVALFVVGWIVAGGLTGQQAPTDRGADVPVTSVAERPSMPVLVRLVVLRPGARTVQAAGDFNEWNPARTPLEQIASGAWTVTIPLEPGRYKYMFVVDGQEWVADPFAVEHSDDGFGSRNAVLDVRPPMESPL